MRIALDSSVLLALFKKEAGWEKWNDLIRESLSLGPLLVCPVVFAEVSMGFPSDEVCLNALQFLWIEYSGLTPSGSYRPGISPTLLWGSGVDCSIERESAPVLADGKKNGARHKADHRFSSGWADMVSSHRRPVGSFRPASAAKPASCRFALQVFAPPLRFESTSPGLFTGSPIKNRKLQLCNLRLYACLSGLAFRGRTSCAPAPGRLRG